MAQLIEQNDRNAGVTAGFASPSGIKKTSVFLGSFIDSKQQDVVKKIFDQSCPSIYTVFIP